MPEPDLRTVAARQEIHQVLMRYCRGVDRGDRDLITSVYHHGAVDRHGPAEFKDAHGEFAEWAVSRLDALDGVTQHHITNYLIELNGDAAVAESYFLAFRPNKLVDGTEVLGVVGGRYLDRFERRGGHWAIVERSVVCDWSRQSLAGDEYPLTSAHVRGGRREADPSHALFAEIAA